MTQREQAGKFRVLQARLDQQGEAPFQPRLVRGVVTAATSGEAPYTVAAAKADGTATATTWTPVWPFPSGSAVAVGASVWLLFEREGENPVIFQPQGGALTGDGGLIGGYIRFFAAG